MIALACLATISDDPAAISVPLEVEAGQGRAGRHIMDPHPLLTPLVPSGHFTHAGVQEQLSGCSSGLHSRFLTPFLLHLRLLRPRHLPGLWGDIFPHPLYIGQLQIPGWSSLHIKNIFCSQACGKKSIEVTLREEVGYRSVKWRTCHQTPEKGDFASGNQTFCEPFFQFLLEL